jgi:hypothetical protein
MSNFVQNMRMRYAASHATPATHLQNPELTPATPAATPTAPISASHAASTVSPVPISPIVVGQDHEDAAHPFQWPAGGKWYSKEQASALADAANAAKPTPSPAQHIVEPVVIAASPVSVAPVEPASENPIAYTTESNVAKAAPLIQPVVAAQPAVQETPAVSTTPAKPNGFVSFLKNIGKVFAKAIGVAGAVEDIPAVQAAENLAFGPAITELIEKWANTAVAVETTAAAAVSTASSNASLTGAQKAAIVVAALNGDAQQVAQQLGASALTQADLAVVNNAVVAILNVFQVPASA